MTNRNLLFRTVFWASIAAAGVTAPVLQPVSANATSTATTTAAPASRETTYGDGTTWGHGEVKTTAGTFYARTGHLEAFNSETGEGCSASLVGPQVALTASHCMHPGRAHRVRASQATIYFGDHVESTPAGSRRVYLYRCNVVRAFTAGGAKLTSTDWAVLGLGACYRQNSRVAVTKPVGTYLGYHGLRVLDYDDDTPTVFTGYPGTDAHPHLRKYLANPTGPSAELRLLHPVASRSWMRVTDYATPQGTSGGGLLAATATPGLYNVVGIGNFVTDVSHSYYRRVDHNIITTVRNARAGQWPTGTWAPN